MRDKTSFIFTKSRCDTVLSLKEDLYDEMGVFPHQQTLLYKGGILNDDLSLSFYGIHDHSVLYLVPKKEKNMYIAKSFYYMDKLKHLLGMLSSAKSNEFDEIRSEIIDILNDPILKGFARIDDSARNLLKNAREVLRDTEKPISQGQKRLLASFTDRAYTQAESSPDGLRSLGKYLQEDEAEIESTHKETTNLPKTKGISTMPMPLCFQKEKKKVFRIAGEKIYLKTDQRSKDDEDNHYHNY